MLYPKDGVPTQESSREQAHLDFPSAAEPLPARVRLAGLADVSALGWRCKALAEFSLGLVSSIGLCGWGSSSKVSIALGPARSSSMVAARSPGPQCT